MSEKGIGAAERFAPRRLASHSGLVLAIERPAPGTLGKQAGWRLATVHSLSPAVGVRSTMTIHLVALRGEVEAALLAELERVGPARFRQADLVRRFEGRGASSRSLFRWTGELLKSGRAAQHLSQRMRAAVDERAELTNEPAAAAASEVVAALPRPITLDEIAGSGPINIRSRLQECFDTARQVAEHARTPGGAVRNAWLLLSAAELTRRSIETAIRVRHSLQSLEATDRFHQAVLDILAQESPELVQRVLARVTQLEMG